MPSFLPPLSTPSSLIAISSFRSRSYHLQTIKLNPSFSKGYSRKGSALHGQRDYEASIKAFKEGLEIEPGSAILKKGLEEVEKALEKDGKFCQSA